MSRAFEVALVFPMVRETGYHRGRGINLAVSIMFMSCNPFSLQMAARVVVASSLAVMLAACAGPRLPPPSSTMGEPMMTADEFRQQVADAERTSRLNEELVALAVSSGAAGGAAYRIGPEDSIRIQIFGVPDLSQEYRVDGNGEIVMPLIGAVAVSGLTLSEAERLIAQRYGESYLRSPQVTVQVTEYRSQQYTVMGSVEHPKVYSSSRQTTLIEALALAGGVSDNAGEFVYVTDRIRDAETGALQVRSMIIPIEDLLRHPGKHNVVLGEGALVNVPSGGFVFVEGDVLRPGAIPQTRTTTVLTALAQAGGLKWEADKARMQLLRRDPDTREWQSFMFSYDEIRANPDTDMRLRNGDVLVVASNPARAAWLTTWKALSGIVFLGGRPFTW